MAATERDRDTLRARGLVKAFHRRAVVDGVELEVRPGEIVGLLGPNGAGKTTTFAMIVGLLRPDAGTILLGEEDITPLPLHARARRGIAYLPQEPSVFRRETVRGNLELVLEVLGRDEDEIHGRATEALEELGLLDLADRPAYVLSGGERRRCEIARAMVTEPRFMLLDEPFAGIDPIAVGEIQRIVRRLAGRGIGILVTDHNVRETLQITDHAFIINEGRIFRSGSPRELAEDPEVRAVYLGDEFSLH